MNMDKYNGANSLTVEHVVERIKAHLGGIGGDDEKEVNMLKEFIIGYLQSRVGSLPVMIALVKPNPIWMNEYVKLDLHAFYTEQNDIYFDDPEQMCHLATVVVSPLALGLFNEIGRWSTNEFQVETYLVQMQKATIFLREMV
jgi:hypothetical protein